MTTDLEQTAADLQFIPHRLYVIANLTLFNHKLIADWLHLITVLIQQDSNKMESVFKVALKMMADYKWPLFM